MSLRLLAEEADEGLRLDRFLAVRLPDSSRATLQRWITEGRVLLGGVAAPKSVRIATGDEVVVDVPDAVGASDILPEEIPLDVAYEDDDLLVVSKPAGMPSHTGPGHPTGTLVNALVARHPEILRAGSPRRPGIVHRLDAGTSGLLAVALTPRAYSALSKMVAAHALRRTYWALLHGRLEQTEGMIEAPIGRDAENRLKFTLRSDGKEARTRFTVLARGTRATEIEARLETGPTHQIRVHFLSVGHPVLGDPVYAKGLWVPLGPDGVPLLARQALHARRLSFRHPFKDEDVDVTSALPADLAATRGAVLGAGA